MSRHFVIKCISKAGLEHYIAIDESSGGYPPYEVDEPFRARIWDESQKDALVGYIETCCRFSASGQPFYQESRWTVVEICFTVRPVKLTIVNIPKLQLDS